MGNKNQSNAMQSFPQNIRPSASCTIPRQVYGLRHFLPSDMDDAILVPLTLIKVDAEIKSFLASVTLTQFYKNIESNPIECEYVFPLDDEGVVSDISIQFDDRREIKADVQPKHQAQQEYSDAIASGHSAMIARTNEPDRMILKVGNLAPNSKARVTVKYITPLTVQNQHWRFIIPTAMTPLYSLDHHFSDEDLEETSTFDIVPAQACPYKIGFKIHLSTYSPIQALNSPSHEVDITYGENNKSASVVLNPDRSYVPDRDFILNFITKDADFSRVMIEEWHGEYTAMISFIPKFLETGENEEDLEGSGEYILVIDRSGSMTGRISIAISAAILFLKSLPIRSKFNIISFGDTYRSMFKSSQIYTKDTIQEAIKKLNKFEADMGGTEILSPLMHIFDHPVDVEYPRTVFLLTDGEVSQPERVAQLVYENVGSCRIHTIGIGNGVDSYLIKEVARAAKGSYSFVTRDSELQTTVMNALKRAILPSLNKWNLDWNADIVPNSERISTLYYNEPFVIFAKGDTLINDDIFLRAWNTRYNRWEDFSPKEFYISKGSNLRKLWGKYKLRELEYALIKGNNVKSDIEKLSTELKIPSSQTSYLAIHYNNDPVTGQLHHRDIPISTTVDRNSKNNIISTSPSYYSRNYILQSHIYNDRPLPQRAKVIKKSGLSSCVCCSLPIRSSCAIDQELAAANLPEQRTTINESIVSLYGSIIDIVSIEGYWGLDSLREVMSVPKLPDWLEENSDGEMIWATLIAMEYLKKKCLEYESEWRLVAGKAKRWLKSKKIEESLYELAQKSI